MKRTQSLKRPMRPILAILLLASAIAASDVRAQWKYDEKQIPLLPPYCKYAMLYRTYVPEEERDRNVEYWDRVLGRKNFVHIHHYCWALENTNRALYFSRDNIERERKLHSTLGDFGYVIGHVRPDFPLLPEILTKQGENLARLGSAKAIESFGRAIELKPDYWPPYAAMSDYFRELGQMEKAREWLERGLNVVKDPKPLQARLRALPKAKTPIRPSN